VERLGDLPLLPAWFANRWWSMRRAEIKQHAEPNVDRAPSLMACGHRCREHGVVREWCWFGRVNKQIVNGLTARCTRGLCVMRWRLVEARSGMLPRLVGMWRLPNRRSHSLLGMCYIQ